MIRPATPADLQAVLTIYRTARAFMAANGNPTQWGDNYPTQDIVEHDIRLGQLYADEAEGRVCGVFAYIPGADPAYAVIDGAWHSDAPYAAVHRVASDGSVPGVFGRCIRFCRSRSPHLRIDTHPDNKRMQALLTGAGFAYCGVIHTVEDGTARWAYDLLP